MKTAILSNIEGFEAEHEQTKMLDKKELLDRMMLVQRGDYISRLKLMPTSEDISNNAEKEGGK